MRLLVQALFVLLLKKCNKIKFLTLNLVYIQTTETEQTMEKNITKTPTHLVNNSFVKAPIYTVNSLFHLNFIP